MNARGFEQIAGKNFDPTLTAASVTSDTTNRIVLLLMLLENWTARTHDVKGAFLKGKFKDGEEIFMEVPQGMEHYYWDFTVTRLLKPIYGLKQVAMLFWQKLLEMMKNMGHKQSRTDPCMYFSRNKIGGLALWLS